jgi:hypothetical protein
MNAEQKAWTLISLLMCVTLIAMTFIMARCSVQVETVDARVGECAKGGGHWVVDPMGGLGSHCEQAAGK